MSEITDQPTDILELARRVLEAAKKAELGEIIAHKTGYGITGKNKGYWYWQLKTLSGRILADLMTEDEARYFDTVANAAPKLARAVIDIEDRIDTAITRALSSTPDGRTFLKKLDDANAERTALRHVAKQLADALEQIDCKCPVASDTQSIDSNGFVKHKIIRVHWTDCPRQLALAAAREAGVILKEGA